MADACGSSGLFGRMAFETAGTGVASDFTVTSNAFPLAGGSSLSLKRQYVNNEGTNGTTSQSSELTRSGLDIVDGDASFLLTPDWMEFMGYHIMGEAYVADTTYPTTAEPPPFHTMLHRDAAVYVYPNTYANTFTVGSTSGETVNASIGFIGTGRPDAPGPETDWPAALTTNKSVPYMHHDAVIEIGGTAYDFRSWNLSFNNNLVPVYFGSTTACGVKRGGLTETTLQLVGPHTTGTIAALLNAAAPPSALDIRITLTSPTAGQSTIFHMQAVQIPPVDPPVGEGEILLDLTGVARTLNTGTPSYSGAEIAIINDNV